MKLYKDMVQYWTNQGLSEDRALVEALKYKGYRTKNSTVYFTMRGYSTEEALRLVDEAKKSRRSPREAMIKKLGGEDKYKSWKRSTCNLSKENMLKNMSEEEYKSRKRELGLRLGGKRVTDISFWTDKGFSEVEAKKKIIENNRRVSPRCIDYWIAKGFSEEDAVLKVSEYQDNTSLNAFTKRYGVEEGASRYNAFVDTQKQTTIWGTHYWKAMGLSDEQAIIKVSDLQKSNSKESPSQLNFWAKKGYSTEDAEKMRHEYVRRKFKNTMLYWEDKGFSSDEAILLIKEVQSERGKKGAFKQRYRFKSSLEDKFDKMTSDAGFKIWTSHVKTDEGKHYFPDFEFEKCFVEINGDYWHGNPSIYGPEAILGHGQKAKEKWESDRIRSENIERITKKPVFVLWESDFSSEIILKEKMREISKYF